MRSSLAGRLACAVLLAGCEVTGPAEPSPIAFMSIAAGATHTCALQTGGKAYCWGDNLNSQLGSGSADLLDSVPRAVASSVSFTQLAGGAIHSCGVSDAGPAWCWGGDAYGQAGPVGGDSPALVDATLHFAMVSLGRLHSCAITTTGAAYCWG
jgi:alpha-tubulin suppressor-like RCC1 family protein